MSFGVLYDEEVRWKMVMLFLILGFWVVTQWPSNDLRVVFCDVGQGDAELIIWKSVQVLIDGGPSGEGVMGCLADHVPFWDRKIEMVVNTHPQKDHLGGLDEVVGRYEIGLLVANGVNGTGKDFTRLVQAVRERGIKVHIPKAGEVFKLGKLEFKVLWPEEKEGNLAAVWYGKGDAKVLGEYSGDVNQISVVMRLSFGEFTAMFTGDLGEKEEQALLRMGVIMPVQVLKVAHHGSKYSSSEDFVKAVRPRLAVVEVGKNNSYGHPSGDVTKRFDVVGSRVLRTDNDGDVVIVSDGKKWWLDGR